MLALAFSIILHKLNPEDQTDRLYAIPADKRHRNNVIITSKRRRFDVIITLLLLHVSAGMVRYRNQIHLSASAKPHIPY